MAFSGLSAFASKLACAVRHVGRRGAEIFGAHPPHSVPAGNQPPPPILSVQPYSQFASRPPAVNLDRRLYSPRDTASVPFSDRLLCLLRRSRPGHGLAADVISNHPATFLQCDAVPHEAF
jgi:hypothetical protein